MSFPDLAPGNALRPRATGARWATTTVFGTQGAAVAAVFTTVPAVTETLRLEPLLMTATLVGVALMAGAGSFAGLGAMRIAGAVTTMRGALVGVSAALTFIGWAPEQVTAVCAYALFGFALGALDVSTNSRAAEVERTYGRSVFGSFYAAWSVGGVAAALVTAGAASLHVPVTLILSAQAGLVLLVAFGLREHRLPDAATWAATAVPASPERRIWITLAPFGLVLAIVYVVDSSISAWSAVYLRQTLTASLTVAPMAYAAYQVGTVGGRAIADRCLHLIGPAAMVRTAAVLIATGLAGMSAAPGWSFAVASSGLVGLGSAALVPLCVASASRLNHASPEDTLARLNMFNYVGVIAGGAASGLLGATGHFRVAFAAPALLATLLLVSTRHFSRPAPVPTELG